MSFRLTFYTTGLLLMLLGMMMLIPFVVEYADGHANAYAFLYSAMICVYFGGSLFFANQGMFARFNLREGFVLTTVSWLTLSFAGALPFYFSDLNISFTDAYFESISGITTTGSTILSGLDYMSRGVLLWRSMLQWIGGIGIVAFGIVLFPFLKIGGMQLFQTESSDRSDKILPQSRQLVGRLVLVYFLLSVFCFVTYFLLGMTFFDALNHAMTTLSTGGYSTHDSSFGYFHSSSMQIAATFFMFLGGVPFVLIVKYMFLGQFTFHKDKQVQGFFFIVLVATIVMASWLWINGKYGLFDSVVLSSFNIVSVVTTTGYATVDYTLWGTFLIAVFFFLTYLGGCAGSTSGGVKIMRLQVVFLAMKQQINKLIYPNGMFCSAYQGRRIDADLGTTVMAFVSLYVMMNVFLTFGLSWVGLDIETAFSGAATAIANVGPGIGDTIGPAGNFASLPDSAKWLLSLGMFLGRLEFLTVFVIFTPSFWEL